MRPLGCIGLDGAARHPIRPVVFTVDRIEDTVARAVARGGEQIGEIQPMGESSRWVYIRDSEGSLIGLCDEVAVA